MRIAILKQDELKRLLTERKVSRASLEKQLNLKEDAIRTCLRFDTRYHICRNNQDIVDKLKEFFQTDSFIAWEGDL